MLTQKNVRALMEQFNLFDSNLDRKLSFDDFSSLISSGGVEMFDLYDIDHDGNLSFEEMSTLLETTGRPEINFDLYDIDRDTMLSREEFSAVVSGWEQPDASKLRVQFDMCDWDGDGQLNAYEFLYFSFPGKSDRVALSSRNEEFKKIDKNKDGLVSLAEAAAQVLTGALTPIIAEYSLAYISFYEGWVRRADLDTDGMLNFFELLQFELTPPKIGG
ncbi:EF-hand domain-containing protein [Streptomyces sp. NPDC092307]|uniref:EF-hand domain-containing protein n=1 Tax=Streptomyces sp. NPDC092307 TaxID=3366013 RepID=UPI00380576D9